MRSKDNFHETSTGKEDNKFENEIKNCENVTQRTHVDPNIIKLDSIIEDRCCSIDRLREKILLSIVQKRNDGNVMVNACVNDAHARIDKIMNINR